MPRKQSIRKRSIRNKKKRILKTRRRQNNRRKRSRVRRHKGGNVSNSHPNVDTIHNSHTLATNNVDMNNYADAHLSDGRVVITKIE